MTEIKIRKANNAGLADVTISRDGNIILCGSDFVLQSLARVKLLKFQDITLTTERFTPEETEAIKTLLNMKTNPHYPDANGNGVPDAFENIAPLAETNPMRHKVQRRISFPSINPSDFPGIELLLKSCAPFLLTMDAQGLARHIQAMPEPSSQELAIHMICLMRDFINDVLSELNDNSTDH